MRSLGLVSRSLVAIWCSGRAGYGGDGYRAFVPKDLCSSCHSGLVMGFAPSTHWLPRLVNMAFVWGRGS